MRSWAPALPADLSTQHLSVQERVNVKYERHAVIVEAIQFNGYNLEDIGEFIKTHSDPNRDPSHRPPGYYRAMGHDFIEVWIEEARTYGRVEVGDYIIASAGDGVYLAPKESFEKAHMALEVVRPRDRG